MERRYLSRPEHGLPQRAARQRYRTMGAKALFPIAALLAVMIGMMLPVPAHKAVPTRSMIETIEIG